MYESVEDQMYALAKRRGIQFEEVEAELESCSSLFSHVDEEDNRRLHYAEYKAWTNLFHVSSYFPAETPYEYDLDTAKLFRHLAEETNLALTRENYSLKEEVRTLNEELVKKVVEARLADPTGVKILVLEEEVRDARTKNTTLMTAKRLLEADFEEKLGKITNLGSEVEDLKQRNAEYEEQIVGLDKSKKDAKKINMSLEQTKTDLENEKTGFLEAITALKREKKDLESTVASHVNTIKQLKDGAEKNRKIRSDKHKKLNDDNLALETKVIALEKELGLLRQSHDVPNSQIEPVTSVGSAGVASILDGGQKPAHKRPAESEDRSAKRRLCHDIR